MKKHTYCQLVLMHYTDFTEVAKFYKIDVEENYPGLYSVMEIAKKIIQKQNEE